MRLICVKKVKITQLVFPARPGEPCPFVGDFFSGNSVMEGAAIFSPDTQHIT